MSESERDRLAAQINDPSTGSIRRRWLQRKLSGVVAVGPSRPPPAKEPPTKADAIRALKRDDRLARQHQETIDAEVAALDDHMRAIEKALPARPDPTERVPYAEQEARAELRQLRELRSMLEEDRASGPVRLDRSGRPITNQMRSYVRFRSREIGESLWASAERADAEGDYRRARQLRRDSLRARMIAEMEAHWRPSLPGYGISPWV